MAEVSIINQPFDGQLGNYLIEELENKLNKSLTIIVAFAKNSGVLRLKNALEVFRNAGGEIHAYVGIDLGGTSYEALVALYNICTSLHIVHIESDQTFHPKIYNFKQESKSLVIIGSNNMTGGGLWTNIESSAIVALDNEIKADEDAQRQLDDYFEMLGDIGFSGSMQIISIEDIENLLANHYVEKEMQTNVRKARERKVATKNSEPQVEHYFLSRISAPLPKIVPVKKETVTALVDVISDESIFEIKTDDNTSTPALPGNQDDYQSFWFETRALTGGSRNILDLSMKARIVDGNPIGTEYELDEAGMMKGGVLFFGVDPERTEETRDITINYNGTDYYGNTIKYPDGERANGTWRLQIKGVSSDERKITDAFDRGELRYKVLVFTKVDADYYYMTIFSDDMLEEFVEASTVVARNGSGRNSKMFGLL